MKKNIEADEAENKKVSIPSAGFSVYIGPTIVGVIQNAMIIPGTPDEVLENEEIAIALLKKPGIADLIVDGSVLSESQIKVKTKGEALYNAYRALSRKK